MKRPQRVDRTLGWGRFHEPGKGIREVAWPSSKIVAFSTHSLKSRTSNSYSYNE